VPTGDCLPTITPNDSSCAVALDDPSAEAEIIHGYSRAQAIADGVLIDVSEEISREAGFTIPVAMTAAAWADCVEWTDADTARTGAIQDVQGRLWDVLWMTRFAIRRARGGNRVRVRLYRVPRHGDNVEAQPVDLVAVCGPGDDAEPVITIMQPGED
jgi:hypothetical protein